ncbi:MAG: hypothetical protein D6820_02985, partial [Lentisphaerae bacterium]
MRVPLSPTGGPIPADQVEYLVKPGEMIAAGQPLALWRGLPCHSPYHGKVEELAPDGVLIETLADQPDTLFQPEKLADDPVEFLKQIGLVGMGGAGFPAFIKLQSSRGKVKNLVINACECEPGVYTDHTVLHRFHEDVLRGARYLAEYAGAETIVLALHANTLSPQIKSAFSSCRILR